MLESLPQDLVTRIHRRATDPLTRTDASPATRGRTVTVGGLSVIGLDLEALLRGDVDPRPPDVVSLPPRADAASIADAEQQLGFALPHPLRQLYSEIANGGFGPGAGLLSLEELVQTYLGLLEKPPGPRGQKWPRQLLPITRDDPGHDCIDLSSGEIVFWDEEELADGVSDKVWKRSFKSDTPDLGAWFVRWLETPSPEQKTKDLMQRGMHEALRQSLAYWRAKTPEDRAAFGLPETEWEEALFGHLGVDLSKL
jgi:SMI1/KNR4 family protein SUKH-1